MLTAQQQELRLRGLGGTDVAAVCGVHPYRTPLDIYLDKRGLVEPFAGNEATRWGHRLEPVIADEYSERTGRILSDCGTIVHAERDWHLGTPDRLIVDEPGGLEIKTAGLRQAHRWGDPDSDEVPDEYLIQCAWYLALTDRQWWDLAVLIGGQEMRIYTIQRNDELEAGLLERAECFWHDHVLDGEPPPATGRDVKTLSTLYSGPSAETIDPTPEHLEAARRYRDLESRIKRLESERDDIKARLCDDIKADAKGIKGVASWPEVAGRKTFDAKAALKDGAISPEIYAQYEKQGSPYRRFTITYKGD